jgi:2-polyprenyl-6-methoxyphenol hydroxylase-like FAD-dependent oxidoreductase
VVLVGDAAHALSPALTQGGSLALEDAVVELLNSGADQIDLAAATRATNAILREPI